MSSDGEPRGAVLVIDDSPETLFLLTDALARVGMTVSVSLDGTNGQRVARRLKPDIVLLDAVMPGIDGFETCRCFKEDPALRDVPIIFMTGLSETEHIVRGFEAGGIDYVTKPIDVAALMARIRTHLVTARATQSARTALDVAGRHLLAVSGAGRVQWMTPQAERTLGGDAQPAMTELPPAAAAWFADCRAGDTGQRRSGTVIVSPRGAPVRVSFVGQIGAEEFLLRLEPEIVDALPAALFKPYRLTGREIEVISWIVKGKSNRDAADILGLSTRTVDKHLEQIFAKLGVENRTAATALALTLLSSSNV